MLRYEHHIIYQSTKEEFASFRNVIEGSYFVQLFCRELEVNGRYLSLRSILNNVGDNVIKLSQCMMPVMTVAYFKNAYFVPLGASEE